MLNQNNSKQFSFQLIFIMLLFLIIVIMSIMIIMLGQNVYENINNDRTNNYEKHISISYIANKVRQADKENMIRLEKIDKIQALVIKEVYDGECYETWIYYYNKGIYELFADEGSEFHPEDGIKIMDVDMFSIEKLNNKLYRFTAENNKGSTELILNLYSNQQ